MKYYNLQKYLVIYLFRGCDACEEWYHGDCINISEKEARYIRQYYCDRCRQEDPTLTTRFKPQRRENDDRDSGIQHVHVLGWTLPKQTQSTVHQ